MPKLAIVLLTYNRLNYALKTLHYALENVQYSGELSVHIADDGSPGDYVLELQNKAKEFKNIHHITYTIADRRGYGGSYNKAMKDLLDKVDYVLPLEDDWHLTDKLDLDNLTGVLDDEARINCIRLGYIGYFHPLFAEFIYVRSQHFLILDPNSPSQYIFSGGPRIEKISYTRNLGVWPERLAAGETELEVCRRPESRVGVAWPVDLIKPSGGLFVHFGTKSIKDALFVEGAA
jgi:glycosyltransferase involved in cell wall biosynthesis